MTQFIDYIIAVGTIFLVIIGLATLAIMIFGLPPKERTRFKNILSKKIKFFSIKIRPGEIVKISTLLFVIYLITYLIFNKDAATIYISIVIIPVALYILFGILILIKEESDKGVIRYP